MKVKRKAFIVSDKSYLPILILPRGRVRLHSFQRACPQKNL